MCDEYMFEVEHRNERNYHILPSVPHIYLLCIVFLLQRHFKILWIGWTLFLGFKRPTCFEYVSNTVLRWRVLFLSSRANILNMNIKFCLWTNNSNHSHYVLNFFSGCFSLILHDIDVPPHRVVGDSARLICNFEMEGDILYSVKWYKDDLEFYRFVPNDRPKLQVFPQKGIHVDVSLNLTF